MPTYLKNIFFASFRIKVGSVVGSSSLIDRQTDRQGARKEGRVKKLERNNLYYRKTKYTKKVFKALLLS